MSVKKTRRQYIVDANSQYRVLAVIVIYIVVAVFLTGLLMFMPSFIGLVGKIDQQQFEPAKELLILHKRFWPSFLIVVVVLSVHSVFIFHRIFGPLFRFKATMKQIAVGDLSFNFRIRKKDFLKDEERVMNKMINSLRDKIDTLKKDNVALCKKVDQLSQNVNEHDTAPESIQDDVAEIRSLQEEITKNLDFFNTNNK